MEFKPRALFGALLRDDHKETLQLIQKTAAYLGSAPNRAQIIPMLSTRYSVNCSYALIQSVSALWISTQSKISHSTHIITKKE